MIDLKLIRENPDLIKDSAKKRCVSVDIDAFLELDKEKNALQLSLDELRELRNKVSKEIPSLQDSEKQEKIADMKKVGDDISAWEVKYRKLEKDFFDIYYTIPNILDETAAVWDNEDSNRVEEKFLEPTVFDFSPKHHYEIWEKKWWIDVEKWSKVSGARFWYLKWEIVFLQFALVQYALTKLSDAWYNPILPPVLVKEPAMFGTWFFPADEDGIYSVNPWEDDLFLVWTAEVPVTSYHGWEIMDLSEAKRYVWYSSCFRREAGSAGKDMKWILRGHQFDKVEMVVFCKQEESKKIHDEMIALEEEIWQSLKIPYQKLNVCSGDLWNPAIKKYDLEAWMPGQEKYREVTSCSNIWEFQARRLWIRYKDENGKTKVAHTLNGTVIALSRCLIAIMENYQTAKGDVMIPEVLRPFMWGKEKI